MTSIRIPTLRQCERAIDLSVKHWMGNCCYVAREFVLAEVVPGQVAFGDWTGTIHTSSAHNLSVVVYDNESSRRHAWVVLSDGRVLDPTRWVFEDRKPYIYAGDAADYAEWDYSATLRARGEAPPLDCCCSTYLLLERLLTRELRVRAGARDVVDLYHRGRQEVK